MLEKKKKIFGKNYQSYFNFLFFLIFNFILFKKKIINKNRIIIIDFYYVNKWDHFLFNKILLNIRTCLLNCYIFGDELPHYMYCSLYQNHLNNLNKNSDILSIQNCFIHHHKNEFSKGKINFSFNIY